ncbi:unnamed protein product [Urochloa humidicola]
MGLGDGDLKNKKASASEGCDNLKRNEAMFSLASLLAAKATVEPAQPSAAGAGKKKRLVRLKQELIDQMISMPFTPGPTIPEERLSKYPESFRKSYAEERASTERLMAFEKGILAQYHAKGYAEVEKEVADAEVAN